MPAMHTDYRQISYLLPRLIGYSADFILLVHYGVVGP